MLKLVAFLTRIFTNIVSSRAQSSFRGTLRFGDYEADPRSGELSKRGLGVALEEKPFRALVILLQRPNEVVTREELRTQLWPADIFIDFDNSLNTVIAKARRALNDSAEKPRFIETVGRRGYRFMAPVESSAPDQDKRGPAASPAAEGSPSVIALDSPETAAAGHMGGRSPAYGEAARPQTQRADVRSRFVIAGAVLVAIAVLLIGLNVGRLRDRFLPGSSLGQIHSLVVLPLENLSGDKEQDYFADGMTDELTTDLAKISSLRVISETSAMRYRGTHPTLRQIAQELDVDAIIEGSVARSGDQVRITAQLIDARNDRHLWAESYSDRGGNALGLQHDVARAIANQIHLTLTPAEARRLEALPTHDQQAYDAYLHAKYRLESARRPEADPDPVIAEAERAVALDPNFADAYVVLAQGCFYKIFDWAGGKEYDEKAFVALGKAIALNPTLAEAYAARGALYYTRLHSFDVASAVADYRRAISLNPNLAEAHHNLAAELTHVGLHDLAVEEFRTTLRLDPQNDGAKYRLGRALWQSQRFAEALEYYERYNIESFEKALTLAYLGRKQQALETIEDVAQQTAGTRRGGFRGDPEDVAAVRAFLYATEAKPQKAEREIQVAASLGRNNDHFHHAAFILAAARAEMGEPHEAVVWLRRVAETGMLNYPLFRDNPSMSKLRGNPEYEQFMSGLKLRWDQLAASL